MHCKSHTMKGAPIQENRFHAPDEKYYAYARNCLENAISEGKITRDDANLIEEFVSEVRATKGISPKRAFKLTHILKDSREFVNKPFKDATISTVYRAIESLRTAKTSEGAPRFSKNTVCDYIGFVKRFFLWMVENEYSSIDERKLKKIQTPQFECTIREKDGLISPEEAKAMLMAAKSSRDRAFIAMLWEGGFRIGELGAMRWGDIKFHPKHCSVKVQFKTKKTRHIPLFAATNYLAAWKADYPGNPEGDAFVFLTSRGEPLQYRGVAIHLQKIARRAGIQKKITPHMFRHSRITDLIQSGAKESVTKLMMWGDVNSKMLANYLHFGEEETAEDMARLNGVAISDKEKKSDAMAPSQCPRCATIAGPTQRYCPACGLPLTEDARQAQTTIREAISENPEIIIQWYIEKKGLAPEKTAIVNQILGFGINSETTA